MKLIHFVDVIIIIDFIAGFYNNKKLAHQASNLNRRSRQFSREGKTVNDRDEINYWRK